MSRQKMIAFILVLTLAVVGVLISTRTPPATVKIYKTTTPLPQSTDIGEQTPASTPPVFVDDTALTSKTSDTASENGSDAATPETQSVDALEPLDAFSDVPGEIEVNDASENDDAFARSPFGFGDFPEIPSDFPRQDVWTYYWKLYDVDSAAAKKYELINRVVINLWKEGSRARGGVLENGKVYPLDDNTAYITWSTAESPDGSEVRRYISNVTTTPAIGHQYRDSHFRKGRLPPGVRVIEHAEGGYNPYDFVNQNP